jgi:hypothetical protein
MFMPVPEQLRGMFPQVSPAALAPRPSPPVIAAADVAPHRRDPQKDARAFPAFLGERPFPSPSPSFAPGPALDPRAAAAEAHARFVREAQRAAVAAAVSPPSAWWEDPLALGSLLILVPPIGLAAVWSSKRYSSDARWALTVMTALTMCLMSAIVVAVLVMR